MTKRTRRGLVFGAVLVGIALVCLWMIHTRITSWDSSEMLALQEEWESVEGRLHGDVGDKNEKLYAARKDVIRRRLSTTDMRNLAATCDSLPINGGGRSEFADDVMTVLFFSFMESGDRESLVTLLSRRFPRAWPADVEAYLARRARLSEPLLVLGEAYSRCKEPQQRHIIANAVRRGFWGLGIQGKDDAEFVKNAMEWYKRENWHLAGNAGYYQNYDHGRMVQYKEHPEYYENWPKSVREYRQPLFVEKSQVPK